MLTTAGGDDWVPVLCIALLSCARSNVIGLLLYQAVRGKADQPCGTLTLAGAFVGQTFAFVLKRCSFVHVHS
jgi:hypothetical protein